MTKRMVILATHRGISAMDILEMQEALSAKLSETGITDDPEYEIEIVDALPTPYADDESPFVFKAPPEFDEPNLRAGDFDDTYRGKCKRLRREARGW